VNERTKKQFIAILLLVACIFSGWLLFLTPSQEYKTLRDSAQLDSLLQVSLTDFNISARQRRTYSTRIDSTFSRITHVVKVPPAFSKTQFHAVLQRRLSSYDLKLPARIVFPEKDMHIQFQYSSTIIGKVQLVTDEDLKMQRSYAGVIVAFEERPPEYLIEDLTTMGEPIAVAVIMNPPFAVPGWWDDLQRRYAPVFIWPRKTGGANLLSGNPATALSMLSPLDKQIPRATLLRFFENETPSLLQETSFSFVDASDAIIFNDEMDEPEFEQAFRTFVQQARNGTRPLAIITGTQQTISWTRGRLNTFKKGGLFLMNPSR
jgi:hypothetical protein